MRELGPHVAPPRAPCQRFPVADQSCIAVSPCRLFTVYLLPALPFVQATQIGVVFRVPRHQVASQSESIDAILPLRWARLTCLNAELGQEYTPIAGRQISNPMQKRQAYCPNEQPTRERFCAACIPALIRHFRNGSNYRIRRRGSDCV